MYQEHTVQDGLRFQTMDPRRLRMSAFNVIARTQDDPAMQVAGMAIALVATCDALDINIRDLLEQAESRISDLDGPFIGVFNAIREYALNEIRRA